MASPVTPPQKPKSPEMNLGPGFRIEKDIKRPAPEIIEQYRQFLTPHISDVLNKLCAMTSEIKNLVNDTAIAGPACTVRVLPGDNLMVHKSLDIAKPGDVVVVDAGGSTLNAVLGDLVCSKAKSRGIQAFVIDGLVRDLPAMQEVGLPVFARGVTPIGPLHHGPGEINFPICCGGMVVNPGDLIVGDPNGVAVIRENFAEEVLQRLYTYTATMKKYVENVKRGEFSNAWVDKILEDAGLKIPG